MEKMKVLDSDKSRRPSKPVILTLGNFDGVHLGHQKLLKLVAEKAARLQLPSVVYTFDPHPLKIVAPHKSPPLITTIDGKVQLIASFGIDYLILARFTKEFAAQHPTDFVRDVLLKQMKIKEVWVGHDYTFGKGRKGTGEYMKELGSQHGFSVYIVAAYKQKGTIVSSSLVRRHIKEGRVAEAAQLLGRPHTLSGTVVKGDGRGATIGFPTANMTCGGELIPKQGVYAVSVTVGGKRRQGVMNIGTAPTFDRKRPLIEVHILDFKRSIYGRKLHIDFTKRLRSEKTFNNPDALTRQIRKDIGKAREVL